MLQNGPGTYRGEENRSIHQHQYQEEDYPTFSSIKMKPRGSRSPLSSAKLLATKVTDWKLTYLYLEIKGILIMLI